jgi:lysophospholipase L1-like esterase
MLNWLKYILELLLLIPLFPFLVYKGKELRKRIKKMPPRNEFLRLPSEKSATKNLLIIGESTAAGVGASAKETTLAAKTAAFLYGKFHVYNLGKNGLTASRLPRLLAHGKPDIPNHFEVAVLMIGANDCFKFYPPWKFRLEIEKMCKLLTKKKQVKHIILPMIPPVQQFPAIPKIMRFFLGWHRRILIHEMRKLAGAHPEIDLIELNGNYAAEFFAEDGIHPSDFGYEKMATEIARRIHVHA